MSDNKNQSEPARSPEKVERFDVLVRKFFREVQQSGLLTEAKRRRFREKPISRIKRRVSAKRKEVIRRQRRGY